MTVYEKLATGFEEAIRAGTLAPGERLPSIRSMRHRTGSSFSTILRAYSLLEQRGFIEARPQSGYYVRAPHARPPSEPAARRASPAPSAVKVSDLVSSLVQAETGSRLLPLGAAVVAPSLLPLKSILRHAGAIARRSDPRAIEYAFPPGRPELRRQIARRMVDLGCGLNADDLVVTTGCLEAINLCLRAVAKAGDLIAVESPAYYGLLQSIESLGMRVLEIPASPQTGIDLACLASAVERYPLAACIVATNFSNPLGCTLPDDGKRELVRILTKAGVPLIEDDICGDLAFGPKRPRPAKAFDPQGMVLYCSSFSKSVAPGLRVGWAAAGRFSERVAQLQSNSNIAAASLPQLAVAEYLVSGSHERNLRRLRKDLSTQVLQMSGAVIRHFPEGIRMTRPTGGFVLWIELPGKIDTVELRGLALRKGISIAPGRIFSSRGRYGNCFRLSCGNPWGPEYERGIRTLGELVKGCVTR